MVRTDQRDLALNNKEDEVGELHFSISSASEELNRLIINIYVPRDIDINDFITVAVMQLDRPPRCVMNRTPLSIFFSRTVASNRI